MVYFWFVEEGFVCVLLITPELGNINIYTLKFENSGHP